MDFARKQLEKYGWTDGKGLGKYENGISEALKPKIKRSVTGVGHDTAKDFTEHWWNALYDKAASNIQVEEKNGKTKKIKRKGDEDFVITNSTWKLNKKQKSTENSEQYTDHFVRTAVLTSGGSKMENFKDSESEEEVEKKDVFKMSDEELFAACEGRTAHKGARHGLKALGKLARIAEQEKLLLAQSRFNGYSHSKKIKLNLESIVENISLTNDNGVIEKKKKKKKRHCSDNNNLEESMPKCVIKNSGEDVASIDSVNITTQNNIVTNKKKSNKSRKVENSESMEINNVSESRKNKKLKFLNLKESTNSYDLDMDVNHQKKKKKKNKGVD